MLLLCSVFAFSSHSLCVDVFHLYFRQTISMYARHRENIPKHLLRYQAPEYVMLMGMWKMLLTILIRTQGTNTVSVTLSGSHARGLQ